MARESSGESYSSPAFRHVFILPTGLMEPLSVGFLEVHIALSNRPITNRAVTMVEADSKAEIYLVINCKYPSYTKG